MTIFNEGRHAIHALGAAVAGRAKNHFAQGLTRAEGNPSWYNSRRSAEAPKRRSAEAPKRRSAEAPKRRSAEAPKRPSCAFMAAPPKALCLPV